MVPGGARGRAGALCGRVAGGPGLGEARRAAGLLTKFKAPCASPLAPGAQGRARETGPDAQAAAGAGGAAGGDSGGPAVAPAPGGPAAPLPALRSVLTEILPTPRAPATCPSVE